jgi:PleD family two-component response regulator
MTKKKKSLPKVLVIDFEADRVEEIERIMRNSGLLVVRCLSPRGALSRIRRELPDAVVVEVIMPGMSGFEIAARMQADDRLARIPVLFITDIQSANGEDHDYFPRPLNKPAFLDTLKSRIAQSGRKD